MSNLIDKIISSATGDAYKLDESPIYNAPDVITTDIPILNIAMSGEVDKGMKPGILTIAGPSKHFKSLFALILASSFLKKHEDGVMVFLDTEGGMPLHYLKACGIDVNKVVHIPLSDTNDLTFNYRNIMESLDKQAPVIFVLDSLGNIASAREDANALSKNESQDMSRAKAIKGFFRIATGQIINKLIPLIVINHTYREMSMYGKEIMSGGTGIQYTSNDVWFIGRRQMKDGKDVVGNEFVIRIEKSRKVKERSEFPVKVTAEHGLDKFSGLFDIAMEIGYITSEKKGWYKVVDPVTGEFPEVSKRRSEIEQDREIWEDLLNDEGFKQAIHDRYRFKEVI